MSRKSSMWLIVFVAVLAVVISASGCSKKQTVKQEAAASPQMLAKPASAPAPVEIPKPQPADGVVAPPDPVKTEVAPPAALAPKPEGAMKPAALDLEAMRIQFAFDDSGLSNQAKETLDKIASWLSKDTETKIRIEGNTCDIGTGEYNLALGDRRANGAKEYLQTLGIIGDRLATISYGKEKPLVPNTSEGNRVKNRRDDFTNIK